MSKDQEAGRILRMDLPFQCDPIFIVIIHQLYISEYLLLYFQNNSFFFQAKKILDQIEYFEKLPFRWISHHMSHKKELRWRHSKFLLGSTLDISYEKKATLRPLVAASDIYINQLLRIRTSSYSFTLHSTGWCRLCCNLWYKNFAFSYMIYIFS